MVKKKSDEANQKEEDLAFIQKCLYNTLLKYDKKHLEIPYKYMITCVSDWRQLPESVVIHYLEILEVRGTLKIKKINSRDKVIEYEPPPRVDTFDIDKHFEGVVEK